MYYAIKGEAAAKGKDYVVLDNSGIEYKLFCSLQTRNEIKKQFQYVKLYTYVEHNEKEISLYGFYTTAERDAFKALIKVNSIGNKIALLVLSSFTPDVLRYVVEHREVYRLMEVKGIGEKVALKIIRDIKF